MLQLANYIVARPGTEWIETYRHSDTDEARTLYDYIIAGNGVFIRAQREGLDACVPVEHCEIRGLADVEPFVNLAYPTIPAAYVTRMLDEARAVCVNNGTPIECLFHLRWVEDLERWRLDKPRQVASAISVRPVDTDADSSYGLALIEIHSHHTMDGIFSSIDSKEEQGFRIYGVFGDIFEKPHLRIRVGIYGHFMEFPASKIFNLPEGVEDCHDDEDEF